MGSVRLSDRTCAGAGTRSALLYSFNLIMLFPLSTILVLEARYWRK